jgi:hypothetical protein
MPALPTAVTTLLLHQHGVAVASQLIAAGLGERRIATAVRRGQLRRLHRGAYALGEQWSKVTDETRHCMCLLAVQLTTPDAVGTALTAATGWGLPVVRLPDAPLVVRSSGLATAVGAHVQRRTLLDAEVVRHCDLQLTTLALSVIDAVLATDLPGALITVDAALRRGVMLPELIAAAEARAPRFGRSHLFQALSAGDPGSESWLESLSRGRAIEGGLPLVLCNVVLRRGRRHVRVDLLWVELGVVGECDGKRKYDGLDKEGRGRSASEVIWDEKRRHEWIEELGFEIARWGYPEVADGYGALVRRFERAVAIQRGVGFRWPVDVTAEIPMPKGVVPLARVVGEVQRLQTLGIPISIVDARRRRVT